MSLVSIPIVNIRLDGDTQVRERIREDIVAAYVEALANGATLPPPVVFFEGTSHWLADGFHRVEARRRAGQTEVECEVREGGQREALLFACGANEEHGLRRSIADKRHAVLTVLADPEWSAWSDREIARACKVSHPFVARLRREAEGTGNVSTREMVAAVPPWTVREPTQALIDTLRGMADPEIRDAFFLETFQSGTSPLSFERLNYHLDYWREHGTWDRLQLAADITAEWSRSKAYQAEVRRRGLRDCRRFAAPRGSARHEQDLCELVAEGFSADDISLSIVYGIATPDGHVPARRR